MSEEMITVKKADLEFVRAYNNALEGMKTLLTRERDEARAERDKAMARIAELDDEIANLTGPKKPTKPFVEARCECGRPASEHIQIENGKGWLHCDGALRLYA